MGGNLQKFYHAVRECVKGQYVKTANLGAAGHDTRRCRFSMRV